MINVIALSIVCFALVLGVSKPSSKPLTERQAEAVRKIKGFNNKVRKIRELGIRDKDINFIIDRYKG
jgi:hypothetical protein